MSNIVKFPESKIVRRNQEVDEANATYIENIAYAERIVDNIMVDVDSHIVSNELETEENAESYVPEYLYAREALLSMVYKMLELDHPLQKEVVAKIKE